MFNAATIKAIIASAMKEGLKGHFFFFIFIFFLF